MELSALLAQTVVVMQVSLGDFVEVIPSEDEQVDGDGQKHFYVVRVTELFQDTEVHHSHPLHHQRHVHLPTYAEQLQSTPSGGGPQHQHQWLMSKCV